MNNSTRLDFLLKKISVKNSDTNTKTKESIDINNNILQLTRNNDYLKKDIKLLSKKIQELQEKKSENRMIKELKNNMNKVESAKAEMDYSDLNNKISEIFEEVKKLKEKVKNPEDKMIKEFKHNMEQVESTKAEMDSNNLDNRLEEIEDKLFKMEYVVTRLYESLKR